MTNSISRVRGLVRAIDLDSRILLSELERKEAQVPAELNRILSNAEKVDEQLVALSLDFQSLVDGGKGSS